MIFPKAFRAKLLIAFAAALFGGPAIAQAQYPNRPITFVMTFSPGGPGDTLMRMAAPMLSTRLNNAPIVFDYRAGAGGAVGILSVINAAPDGYTVLYSSNGIVSDQALKLQPAFDARKQLRPVTRAFDGFLGILASPRLPVNTLRELIEHAKVNPGKLNYASPGPGSFAHLASELFNQSAGINVVHVAYKGFGPVVAATMANETQVLLTSAIATKPMWQAGKLKLLAIATGQRSAQTPDIPTAAEAGLPGFQALFWFGAFLPAATPDNVASRLEREFIAVLKSPEIRDKVEPMGFSAGGSTSDEFRRQVDAEIRQWEEVVRKAGIHRE